MAFNFGYIVGNPFYLSTLGLAIIGWIIQLSGAAAAKYKGIVWFFVVYELFIIIGIFVAIATNTVPYYRLAILSFLSVSIVFLSETINTFIYGNISSEYQAVAAGAIFLSIVMFVWIISFGSEDGSSVVNIINSMSINKATTNLKGVHPNIGFPPSVQVDSGHMPMPTQDQPMNTIAVSPNADYAYKAKALYDYQASPDDHNELSFFKGDVLDIVDNKGKWWQAKKADGTIGIAPSNYLQIV